MSVIAVDKRSTKHGNTTFVIILFVCIHTYKILCMSNTKGKN